MAEDGFQNRKKPQFGTRYLTDQKDAYKHNAWDDVEWSEDLKRKAEEKIKENSLVKVSTEEQAKYECEANLFWNKFYTIHENKFFKDRHWLFTEFPELSLQPSSQRTNILEVGCGVGNTVFPILETNIGSDVFVYCCDFSEVAVSIVQNHPSFDAERCCPFVCDISSEEWKVPFEECSLDFIIFVFVLSAIHPDKMQGAVNTLSKYLKPGGSILFRDYGRYDLVELRFKPGRCLAEHFYVRGDGTRVYFFSEEEVNHLFSNAGLVQNQLYSSKRLQVNRGKHIQMYRIWIQAKYMKPQCLPQE